MPEIESKPGTYKTRAAVLSPGPRIYVFNEVKKKKNPSTGLLITSNGRNKKKFHDTT